MKLREIDDAKDPGAVSGNRGKVGGKRYHVEFSTYTGFPSRIFYKVADREVNGKSSVITDIVNTMIQDMMLYVDNGGEEYEQRKKF